MHYQWALMDIIKNINKTVLAVFHELNLAAHFCDYLFVIDKGKIVADGTPQQLYTPELFADIFRIEADTTIAEDGKPYVRYKRAITKR